jgi:nucleotide-binding universal stress UspA family protein
LKVLIAMDASPVSQRVLEEAVARPWPTGTSFCVVNAIDVTRFSELPALIEDAKREGERIIKEGAAKLIRTGHAAESNILWGPPRHAVSSYAADWGAYLIFTGSHGRSAIGRFVIGSVAQGILRKAHCSVEIVRTHREAQPPSSHAMKILLASDGSEFSLAAARSVASRPWPAGTEFQILSVEELVTIDTALGASSLSSIYPASLLEELMADSRARARAAAELAKEIFTQAGLKIPEPQPGPAGDPRAVILETAQLWPADLIVLGSHGRSGLDRFLMGSVSEAVAIHAHCSVEVIRTQAPAANG